MAQSCLEIVSMKERDREIKLSHYRFNEQYSAQHPDAIADGDVQGKGTQSGGMHHWLPDCSAYNGTSQFRFDDFDTAISSGAGNNCDNKARNAALARSKYNGTDTIYSELSVDTSASVLEGQVVFGSNYYLTTPCPIK